MPKDPIGETDTENPPDIKDKTKSETTSQHAGIDEKVAIGVCTGVAAAVTVGFILYNRSHGQ